MSNFVELSIAKAINAGLRKAMQEDPKVILFGEDVAQLGGVFRVTEGIHAEFGDSRIFNSPIAESGIVGTAIGLAMRGYRPVAEIQFDGFIFPAFDQIVSQLAKMQNRSEGFTPMPVVIRVPYGGGIGAVEHHSESPEAYFAHTAGLRVITPSNPNDAYWMIQQAIKSNDPVMFFEPKRRYWQKGPVNLDESPMGAYQARVLLEGSQVTIATYGPMTAVALQAAEIAASEGTSIEVIDIRSLSPIDFDTIINSVKRPVASSWRARRAPSCRSAARLQRALPRRLSITSRLRYFAWADSMFHTQQPSSKKYSCLTQTAFSKRSTER